MSLSDMRVHNKIKKSVVVGDIWCLCSSFDDDDVWFILNPDTICTLLLCTVQQRNKIILNFTNETKEFKMY